MSCVYKYSRKGYNVNPRSLAEYIKTKNQLDKAATIHGIKTEFI